MCGIATFWLAFCNSSLGKPNSQKKWAIIPQSRPELIDRQPMIIRLWLARKLPLTRWSFPKCQCDKFTPSLQAENLYKPSPNSDGVVRLNASHNTYSHRKLDTPREPRANLDTKLSAITCCRHQHLDPILPVIKSLLPINRYAPNTISMYISTHIYICPFASEDGGDTPKLRTCTP